MNKIAQIQKPIKVRGATEPAHMALAFRATQDFLSWDGRKYVDENQCSAAMKITVGKKGFFGNRKPTHNLYVFEKPDEFVVQILFYSEDTAKEKGQV